MLRIALTTLFSLCFAIAQQSTSNKDLRGHKLVWSIKKSGEQQLGAIKSAQGSVSLVNAKKELRKIGLKQFEKIDRVFVGKFLDIKYGVNSEDNCKKSYELFMRGETAHVCLSNKNKTTELAQFIEAYTKN